MRRSEKQMTDTSRIETVIRDGKICHLAMVDDGMPYLVPINFGYAAGSLYFHSAPEGRKIDILTKNPDVCFNIVSGYEVIRNKRACSCTANFRSVTGSGRAVILRDRDEKEKGLAVLMGQYSEDEYDFSGEDLDGLVVIRVDIGEMTGKESP